MEIIKPGTNFDFVRFSKFAFLFSGTLILASILSLVLHGGPNYGIDFAGGVMVHLRFQKVVPIQQVRSALSGLKMGESTIQEFGSSGREFLVRLPSAASQKSGTSEAVTAALAKRFGKAAFQVLRVELVGPRVGKELRERAILAVLFSTLMMGIYIWFRFELRFGIGAGVALMHDVTITIGVLSLLNYEFDLTVVAALLTIVGFSVNDTVIVSDRIRENMRKNRRDPLSVIVNRSINETLSRTVLTTGTAILVIMALFLLGGDVIHPFALCLLVGFTIGTYSSIYIASPIVLALERTRVSVQRRRR